jgi:hypothetical protein
VVLVFLSYRRRDSAFAAQALRYALRLAGHEVFIDVGAITPGEAFREVIREALGRSQLVLVLVGPSSTRVGCMNPSILSRSSGDRLDSWAAWSMRCS